MHRASILFCGAALVLGCSGNQDPSDSGDSSDSGLTSSGSGQTTTTGGSDTDSDTGDGSTTGGSDSDSGTTGDSSTTDDSTSAGTSGGGVKFDLGVVPDGGEGCDGGGNDIEFSYIWIANSSQGTVSKINTQTLVEEGRYATGPAGQVDPSRTSVSLAGNVAVVNRQGGITKIFAVSDDCTDANNNGMIDTSTGPADVRAWGQDECVAWNTPLLAASRPAAWTTGDEIGEDGCGGKIYENEKVWAGAPNGFSESVVYLIDGATGNIDNQVAIPAGGSFGVYGGAVDPENDFWGVIYSQGPLVHVRISDMTYETIALPVGADAYGFTVDSKGRSWVGGWSGRLNRYDPATQQWTTVPMPGTYSALTRGMMEDQNGHIWGAALGSPNGIIRVDADAATYVDVIDQVKLPGVSTPTGASVDVDGIVWMVDQSKDGGGAWVYDPIADTAQWVGGLVSPYTYSDMTGWALKNVANPSG